MSFPPSMFLILSMFISKGDIEIIAALGDGLVAGMGALSSDIRDLSTQHRGVSFVTGNTALGIPFT
jgi:hypothetical protein